MRIGWAGVFVLCGAGFLGICGLATAQKQPSAIEHLAQLRDKANAARKAGDLQARLQAILAIRKLLNDAPDAVELAAKAYAEVGDTDDALTALSQFADLGQADDAMLQGENKPFAAIEKSPQYQAILKRFVDNKSAISRAEPAFSLSDAGLLAEDIDYDTHSKTFLITSVLEKKIIRVAADGKAKDFAASPSGWPMLAIKVDAAHNRVWATEVAMDGFTIVPKADWGRSAVLCFHLASGTLLRRIEGTGHTALGDLVLAADGTPIVSDGDGGGVYKVNGERLERIDAGDFISPQTAAMYPDGRHVFVPDYARGIGVLDPATGRVEWINQGKHAVNGIDGLYYDRGSLIATQNGTSPERVIRFALNSAFTAIVSEQVVERATQTLGDPTHGVVMEDYFYYIANSGWSKVDDHGDLKQGAKLSPASIMRYRLGGKS